MNFVELSRRGYVVFSMDMISHGNSEGTEEIGTLMTGMYEAVKMLDSLDYVDSEKIGITGHSLGGMSSNLAVVLDNMAERQLISAVLLNSADATYQDDAGNFVNVYGSRDVGIIAPQYDEFFFVEDENGNAIAQRDYINYGYAQSFLYFGTDAAGMELRAAGTIYTQDVDGESAIRAIYTPAITHPWSHFSQRSTVATIEFFEAALGASNPIEATSQVWQWKAAFNFLGLVGITMFLVSFAVLMVFTPAFASLRAKELVAPRPMKKGGALWFWGSLLAGAVFGILTYAPILTASRAFVSDRADAMTAQSSPWGVSLWAMVCGLFAVLCMALSYFLFGKKNGFSLRGTGVTMPVKQFGKTALLALIVTAVTYSWVFVADYFFQVDFRIWVIALKAFEADKVLISIFPYAVFFLIYYVANSVAVNSFNYNDIGRRSWVNPVIVALFNAVPPAVLLLIQYVPYFITGHITWPQHNMIMVWLFPILVFLPLTAVLARKIYKMTNNPYLGGIVNGLMITIISCSNTLTWVS
ncbi:MAG: S9 family peptidase [Clostridiales bacterium]|nr:S9 family peptidase [Clostridiales bacterium]